MGKCVEVIGTLIYRDIFVRFKTMGRKEFLLNIAVDEKANTK